MKWPQEVEKVLLIIGSLLVFVYTVARIEGFVMSRAALWSYRAHASGAPADKKVSGQAGGSGVDFTLWSENRVRAYKEALGMKLDPPLAILSIPKIRIAIPVFDGTDDLVLNRGAGRIAGTAGPGEQGNVGIAAHRDGFFRGLKDVRLGDRIELEARGGKFQYAVDNIEIVEPSDVSVLRARPQPSLTLVTCYPFYFVGDAPQRYIVHASLVESDGRNEIEIGATNQKR